MNSSRNVRIVILTRTGAMFEGLLSKNGTEVIGDINRPELERRFFEDFLWWAAWYWIHDFVSNFLGKQHSNLHGIV